MKRRTFITMAGVGTGLVILPPALYLTAPSLRKYATKLIKEEFYYLKLEPLGLDQYIEDYFGASANNMMINLKWKTYYYLGYGPEKSNQLFEMIKYYLLSSNFFINKTDESKVVKYLGLYSPYKSPLPNPYSYLLYPPDHQNT